MVTGEQPLLINIRKLESRRVDTVIENMQVMDYSLRKYRISGIRLAGCDAPTPIYMAISPKRDDAGKVASMLAIGIRKMRQSGKMRELLARYGLSDWK
jgi:polar amino acid transport system substrate-binding protein